MSNENKVNTGLSRAYGTVQKQYRYLKTKKGTGTLYLGHQTHWYRYWIPVPLCQKYGG
jgi:hypothetical protein